MKSGILEFENIETKNKKSFKTINAEFAVKIFFRSHSSSVVFTLTVSL